MTAITVITGASGGIGADLARIFARNGHKMLLIARNGEALSALSDELSAQGAPRPLVLPLDLATPGAAQRVVAALRQADATAGILVNNAGYGLAGTVAGLDTAEQLGIVNLNVRALTELTLLLLPDLIAARGRLLNVASTAAYFPGPGMAVYYASKAFVLSLSEAMHQELKKDGVSVTVLCPGATATGFFDRAGVDANMLKMLRPMSSMTVAEAGYAGLMAGRRVAIPGVMNKVAALLSGVVPHLLFMPLLQHLQAGRGR
ncbi:SDR family oxidoreductase [Roseiarcaceae bacterium H3SJ34-1]|uniref:SDR family NAD(P)-dependent oxidoreductase n=1 Tax=Terripilifer ovatus TaxID=3032367 RepID=UPI003AB99721|nr:SDR family oxidoreductase [Roseiarcaceae bacterium H3SJ34-1]